MAIKIGIILLISLVIFATLVFLAALRVSGDEYSHRYLREEDEKSKEYNIEEDE